VADRDGGHRDAGVAEATRIPYEAFASARVKVVGGRTPASTAPTTFESFAKELAAARGAAG